MLRFAKRRTLPEAKVKKLITAQGFSTASMSYRLDDNGRVFEYRTSIQAIDQRNLERLAAALRARRDVLEFHISPTGD